ncbi:MAG: hypothetical protein GY854_16760 [Deltaproteobacteria bacterium]|nr:hypothetical protein [Deltaproteobacteria bacterium]
MRKTIIGTIGFTIGLLAICSSAQGEDSAPLQSLEAAAKTAAVGMKQFGEIHTGHLEKRGTTIIEVQLDRARCYTFIAVGGKGAADISLTVSSLGKEVASDRISGKQPVTKWCSPGRAKVEIKLAMYDGSGSFALGVYAPKDEEHAKAEKVGGKDTDFIANRVRQLHGQFGKDRAAISKLFRGNLSTGNEQVFKVRLRGGHCYSIIAAGSPSVRNLDLILIDKTGRELDRDTSKNNFPSLETNPCIKSSGQYRVKVNMFSGYGQFGFQVFSD